MEPFQTRAHRAKVDRRSEASYHPRRKKQNRRRARARNFHELQLVKQWITEVPQTIERLGSGLAAWRMPVAEFDGNSARLGLARPAWNRGG